MNPKFILPVSFALAAHVFLLFGLPGRTPVDVAPATAEPPLPTDNTRRLLLDDDPVKVAGEPGDPDPVPDRSGKLAPRLDDIPLTNPGPLEFVIPPLPRIDPGNSGTRIDANWVAQREEPDGSRVDVINSIDLDHVPRARVQPSPAYPGDMRAHGVEGSVVVEFLVDEAGNAYNPMVVSATRREFEEPALRAVARWKFEPGFKNGHRVRYRMSVPLMFKMDRD